jgi:pimeloyl-ACP methyl ester carboxylesterase
MVGGMSDDAVRPYRIDVPDEVLDDLRHRLDATRWPEAAPVDDWSQGAPLYWIQDICQYWAHDYDWRARESRLNRFDQFVTTIDGLDIHFVHQRSPNAEAKPLVITHGWPGSIVEFHKVIEPLTNPTEHGGQAADAFHVICPALPGFGFSGKPTRTGWGVERIASAWATLMARLGYDRYFAQGGDWGSAVTRSIGGQDEEHCEAIHITLAMGTRPRIDGEPNAQEQRAIKGGEYYQAWDSGYSKQQATRPQTVGYGLADSPAGQAAWILEKFWAWTDCDGHPENILHRDELLDNVMFYWATNSATSSARIYWESFGRARAVNLSVPVGVAVYPKEIVPPVRSWMEADYPNIVHWSEQPKGGHFAAFEQPELFVADVRTCFRQFR